MSSGNRGNCEPANSFPSEKPLFFRCLSVEIGRSRRRTGRGPSKKGHDSATKGRLWSGRGFSTAARGCIGWDGSAGNRPPRRTAGSPAGCPGSGDSRFRPGPFFRPMERRRRVATLAFIAGRRHTPQSCSISRAHPHQRNQFPPSISVDQSVSPGDPLPDTWESICLQFRPRELSCP